MKFNLIISILFLLSFFSNAQKINKFGFDKFFETNKGKNTPFAVLNDGVQTVNKLKELNYKIKKVTNNYIYFSCKPENILELINNKTIKDFYFSSFKPELLNDSSRVLHFVNQVHAGQSPLPQAYTGKNVIIGYIDTGCDFQHPDFKDASGNSRIIRYWDHNLPVDAIRTPQDYGYGQVFDSIDLNNMLLTPDCSSGHGTTVAGAGSGNGLANGLNAGMAPDSKIVIVDFNFNDDGDWTLKVADACDYIFKVADEYELPAVINISLGQYFGSHDGDDPASEFMETLLDEKEGRIIVSAAGNSGAYKNYHLHDTVTNEGSFFWLSNNPSGALGTNTAFFDLWGTQSEVMNINFSFSAVNPNNNFETRGQTTTYNVLSTLGSVINEQILNSNGDTIALIDIYTGTQANAYNMFAYIKRIDTTSYYISFNTNGTGVYDAWTGANYGANYQFVENIPTAATYPQIINYVLPDSLQTIVSDWNCSEKVVSVGNFRNRKVWINMLGDTIDESNEMPLTGMISPTSSIGPTRKNVQKPEISASGEASFSPITLCFLQDPNNYYKILPGDWHTYNGGTSMSAPVVAGIAALYLEKCPKSTYQDFRNDLIATAYTDQFTGNVPNFAYGYGKAHALNLLSSTNFDFEITGPESICTDPIVLGINTTENITNYLWSTNETSSQITLSSPTTINVEVKNEKGCKSNKTKTISQEPIINPSVSINTNDLTICDGDVFNAFSNISGGGANPNYSWKVNGIELSNNSNFSSSDINNGDIILCELLSSEMCTSQNPTISNSLVVNVTPITSPIVNITADDTEICPDQSISFNSSILNDGQNTIYSWFHNGQIVGNNSSNVSLNGFLNGDYVYCKVQTDNECAAENSDISNIIVIEVYGIAVIDNYQNGLISISTGDSYQWYSCETNQAIIGATEQIFYPNEVGSYYVVVNNGGCESTSICLSINQLNINKLEDSNTILIYPNPFNENVQFNINKINFININLINSQGQLIKSYDINDLKEQTLDLNFLARGIYTLEFLNKDFTSIKHKIIKL